jgi:hypothetical protein
MQYKCMDWGVMHKRGLERDRGMCTCSVCVCVCVCVCVRMLVLAEGAVSVWDPVVGYETMGMCQVVIPKEELLQRRQGTGVTGMCDQSVTNWLSAYAHDMRVCARVWATGSAEQRLWVYVRVHGRMSVLMEEGGRTQLQMGL